MKITALDVLEMEDKIHVAVALLQQESTAKSTVDKGGVDSHDVYWATIDRPSLVLQNAPLVSAASALEGTYARCSTLGNC